MSEFNLLSLEQSDITIIDGDRGKSYPKQEDFLEQGFCLFLSTKNVREDGFDFSDCQFISKAKDDSLRKGKLQRNDIVLTTRGTLGNIGFYNQNISYNHIRINSGMVILRSGQNVDSKFIYLFLKSNIFKNQVQSFQSGSAQPQLPIRDLKGILIPDLLLSEQKRIANILSCLDAKIENLRRQNETLEQIAQTLFKHWFIDFEFPNADGKPYKSSGGAMSPSELGDIPEGWRVGKLGDYLSVKHGYAFKGEYITIEETKKILLTPGNFKIGGGFNDSKYKYYSDDDYSDEYILRKKDLTVTMTDLSKEGDTLGYPAFIPEVKDKVFLHNQRIGKIENNKIDKTFLYFLLCRREYRFHILGTSSGSTVRHTSPSRIYDFNFMIPDFELVDKFSTVATSTIDKILINCEQIQTLTKTRDTLLPKLMSGQLRVKE